MDSWRFHGKRKGLFRWTYQRHFVTFTFYIKTWTRPDELPPTIMSRLG